MCTRTSVKAEGEEEQIVSGLVWGVRGCETMRRWLGVKGVGVDRVVGMVVCGLPLGVLGVAEAESRGAVGGGVVARGIVGISLSLCEEMMVRVSKLGA